MMKIIFLALTISFTTLGDVHAENWELVGDTNSEFEGIINNFEKKVAVKEKDVLEAFRKYNYNVYIDTDSITDVGDDKRTALQKIVFDEELEMKGTDKKFKYALAEMSYHCAMNIIWFENGGVYDSNGELLRNAQTVFVSVPLSKISKTSLERLLWEEVCLHYKPK